MDGFKQTNIFEINIEQFKEVLNISEFVPLMEDHSIERIAFLPSNFASAILFKTIIDKCFNFELNDNDNLFLVNVIYTSLFYLEDSLSLPMDITYTITNLSHKNKLLSILLNIVQIGPHDVIIFVWRS